MLKKPYKILGKVSYYLFVYPKIKHAELLERQLADLDNYSYDSPVAKYEKRKLQLQINKLRGTTW